MSPLDLVRLSTLMQRNQGLPEITVALIDGPVVLGHPDLTDAKIREVPRGRLKGTCTRAETMACTHATLVAGILCARRGSVAPAICPGCTLLVRAIFSETDNGNGSMPSATPESLAEAIVNSVDAGARIINLSSALSQPSRGDDKLEEALNYAARRSVITVAAAGNQGTVGSSAITRHPWVIPVAACNTKGRPLDESNLGGSIGRRGLSAPGENITSLGTNGKPRAFCGTSAAAPFVTGAAALLWSEFPDASAVRVKLAITRSGRPVRNTLIPRVLDAGAAYEAMASVHNGRNRQ
jgi:subtilisin family serine protease